MKLSGQVNSYIHTNNKFRLVMITKMQIVQILIKLRSDDCTRLACQSI